MALSFSTHDDPKDPTFNQLLSINDFGQIAGYFGEIPPRRIPTRATRWRARRRTT